MRTLSCSMIVCLGIALAACQSAPGQSASNSNAAGPAATQAVIRGKAIYLQRIALAPGATLHVQLIDNQLADTPKAIIAEQTFSNLSGPPYAFALAYDPGKLRADGLYGLHASLYDADGRLMFITDTRVPYTPGYDDVGEFRLKMVQGGDTGGPRTPAATPWDRARARGVGFRAVGNEPGWLVEVGKGGAPALHAELDYGQRKLDIAQAQPAGQGYQGQTADGTRIRLEIERMPCTDDMSGKPFPAKTTLHVGDKAYTGCGAFLHD